MLAYLHGDHLLSTAVTSNGSGVNTGSHYYTAYGRYRGGSELGTENRFTSQKLDATGLYYYNARYYDPQLGTFLSPDTIVPDPTNLLDYNRYGYARGNPLKYNDPSGHWVETGLDLLSLGMTVQDINENGLGWQNGIGLVADVGSLIAPGVAGGGAAVRYADEAYAASKAGVNAAWDWGKRALGYGDEAADAGGDLARQADNLPGNPCAINSFSADTPVMTAGGLKPIAELQEGDLVLAYNEATGQVEIHPITDTISHVNPEIVLLTLAGDPSTSAGTETLETTAEHPFYEMGSAPWLAVGESQGRWTEASELHPGDLVWQADGTTGVVQAIQVVAREQWMYNLSVDTAHTFFVGQQQWLVHNQGPCGKIVTSQGDLLTTMNKGDTKQFLKQSWDPGTFASELDTAAYHLNKHGRGTTIQEYTEAAQKFYKEFRRSAEAIPSKLDAAQTVYRIRNSSGMGIFTKEGKIITYEPTIWPK